MAPGKRSALASIDIAAPCPHRRPLPRPPGRTGVDHQQSHCGAALGVQHQAEPADLAGVDVIDAGSGACRTAPTQAVWQRFGRDHARACRANAQQGISLHDTGRMVPAVRPIPSGPSGACKPTGRDDAGALGGSQDDPSSRRRMRKAEASSHQGPAPSGPERAGEATGRAATEGSGKAPSEAAHLQPCRRAAHAADSSLVSVAAGTSAAQEPSCHAAARLLCRSAPKRACPPRSRRRRPAMRHDHHPRDEVLQDQNLAAARHGDGRAAHLH